MLTPEQSRAARAWLGWTQAELAERAQVGLSTIKDFEGKARTPIANNLQAILKALEAGGMQMLFDAKGAPVGVALASYKLKK
jgi:transcriptional regulator with XRE-family HTH domain